MITKRPNDTRGKFNFGWLDTAHSFSFGEYYDSNYMSFGSLRVINEDRVKPGRGFPQHPHRDAEIISLVVSGALAHKDSMGNSGVIRADEVQYMSAGSGVEHSEFNHSATDPVYFFQIWIKPSERGAPPRYDHRPLASFSLSDNLRLIASPNGAADSIAIRQDVKLFEVLLKAGESVELPIAPTRKGWLQLIEGSAAVGALTLKDGDAAIIEKEPTTLQLRADTTTRALLFDLA